MEATVEGFNEPRFDHLRTLLAQNLRTGKEIGVSVAVMLDGEQIVDLWGGFADSTRSRAWQRDTVVNVWSSTKMVTNLAALVLTDRGLLDLDAPVAQYWPEFTAEGKGRVLVRHVLSHTSGVSGWDQPMSLPEVYDLKTSTERLAAQSPWWEPGTASGYHAMCQGHLVGELVRRVSGMSLTDFIRNEIAGPLQVDFQIGLRAEDDERAAQIVPPPPLEFDFEAAGPDSVMVKTLLPPTPAEEANSTAWRRAEIGAANGHGNARSLSKALSPIALGGVVDGHRLLSAATIDRIFEEQVHGTDLVLGIPLRWGIGYALPELSSIPYIPQGRICFWGGWGGSMTVIDVDRRMTISYAMNQMAAGIIGSERSAEYVTAVYAAIA